MNDDRKRIVGIIIGGIAVFAIAIAIGKIDRQLGVHPETENSEEQDVTAEANEDLGYTPGEKVSQDYGKSGAYYRGEASDTFSLDFGSGKYNLTDSVRDWAFGTPVLSAKDAASVMGLTLTTEYPANYKHVTYVETYDEEDAEKLDLNSTRQFFLVDNQGNYLAYRTGSSTVLDKDGNQYATSYFPEVDPSDENNILISSAAFPYVKNGVICGFPNISVKYSENEMTIEYSSRDEEETITDESAEEIIPEEESVIEESITEENTETIAETITETVPETESTPEEQPAA